SGPMWARTSCSSSRAGTVPLADVTEMRERADGRVRRAGLSLASAAAILALCGATEHATAAKYKLIHSFCAEGGCPDGAFPAAPLLAAGDGTLYGSTVDGGAVGFGVIFSLVPEGNKYKFSILNSVCGTGNGGCPQGSVLVGGLIIDTS